MTQFDQARFDQAMQAARDALQTDCLQSRVNAYNMLDRLVEMPEPQERQLARMMERLR
jgi:hypothetical protein